MGAAARLACLPPSHCASLPPLSPLLASIRRRQFHAALESAFSSTMMLVLENGRALAESASFVDGSRSGGCGWHTGAVGRRPAGRLPARPWANGSRIRSKPLAFPPPKRVSWQSTVVGGWSGNNRNSVPLRELPPQRGPRQFPVERFINPFPTPGFGRRLAMSTCRTRPLSAPRRRPAVT